MATLSIVVAPTLGQQPLFKTIGMLDGELTIPAATKASAGTGEDVFG
jgi:hypothetical protein